jgi:hypothetical protein
MMRERNNYGQVLKISVSPADQIRRGKNCLGQEHGSCLSELLPGTATNWTRRIARQVQGFEIFEISLSTLMTAWISRPGVCHGY